MWQFHVAGVSRLLHVDSIVLCVLRGWSYLPSLFCPVRRVTLSDILRCTLCCVHGNWRRYHYCTDTDTPRDYPVVLLEGLSHWSFSSGTPPALVAKSDLHPAVTADAAHTAIAAGIANFMAAILSKSSMFNRLDSRILSSPGRSPVAASPACLPPTW